MVPTRNKFLKIACERAKDRVGHAGFGFVAIAMIPATLVVWFVVFLMPTLNHRFGMHTQVSSLESAPDSATQPLWFSISVNDKELAVATGNRRVFRFDRRIEDLGQIKEFTDYVREEMRKRVELAVLSLNDDPQQFMAIISADESLRYAHVRPFLQALAEVGIYQYGFEVKRLAAAPGQEIKSEHQEDAHHH